MGIKIVCEPSNPDDIEYTLQITMPLREWIKLKEDLGDTARNAGYQLKRKIADIIEQAETTFYPKEDES